MGLNIRARLRNIFHRSRPVDGGILDAPPRSPVRISPSKAQRPVVVEVLEPGLVVLRQIVDDEGCERLARAAFEMGSQNHGDDGFYMSMGELNTGDAGRGRIYDAASRFPSFVVDHCSHSVQLARERDSAMPEMDCTHVLLNMYTNSDGFTWHRDIYENDGRSDHTVVNLCVGASCSFGYKHKDEDEAKILTLRSGDCILFGGPCRLIKHSVLNVDLNDCPAWMKDQSVRFSFTFRDSPEVLGREHEFKYFRVSEHLVGQETFHVPVSEEQRKSRRGLPSMATQKFDPSSMYLPAA